MSAADRDRPYSPLRRAAAARHGPTPAFLLMVIVPAVLAAVLLHGRSRSGARRR